MLAVPHLTSMNVLTSGIALISVIGPQAPSHQVRAFNIPASSGELDRPKLSGNTYSTSATLNPLLERIRRFGGLAENWDGPGSVSPKTNTVKAALEFARSLPLSISPPNAVAAGDGEISLSWQSDEHFVDVSFRPDSSSVFAHVAGNTYKTRKVTTMADMPLAVIQALSEA